MTHGLLRAVCALLLALTLLGTSPAGAQEGKRIARIGWLGWLGGEGATPSPVPLETLRQALRERGWVDGTNLTIEARAGVQADSRKLTEELLRTKVDLIVAQGPMIFGAKTIAGTTPLIFAINGDPVEAKLVASLARPGGSLTGTTALVPELVGKRVELLKEIAPGITRIAAVANVAYPGLKTELREAEDAARRLGVSLQFVPVSSVGDFPAAFDVIARAKAQALIAFPDDLINDQAKSIAAFAAKQKIPAISGWAEFAEAGNVLSYGASLRETYRRLATYVDKILKGVKPADLPVERPTTFELVVNTAAAAAIGVTIPKPLLLRANRVIQ